MTYSTLEIVSELGIPRERLRDWMNRGFITPSIPANGQGTKAVFTLSDVCDIAVFKFLVDKGLDRNVASKLIKEDKP
jgi:hypothetical protein